MTSIDVTVERNARSIDATLERSAQIDISECPKVPAEIEISPRGPMGAEGPPGPPGAKGDKGDPGNAGTVGPSGGGTVRYDQASASDVWTFVHNLGLFPVIFVIDSAGTPIIGDVSYPDLNTVVITFANPEGGTALLTF